MVCFVQSQESVSAACVHELLDRYEKQSTRAVHNTNASVAHYLERNLLMTRNDL